MHHWKRCDCIRFPVFQSLQSPLILCRSAVCTQLGTIHRMGIFHLFVVFFGTVGIFCLFVCFSLLRFTSFRGFSVVLMQCAALARVIEIHVSSACTYVSVSDVMFCHVVSSARSFSFMLCLRACSLQLSFSLALCCVLSQLGSMKFVLRLLACKCQCSTLCDVFRTTWCFRGCMHVVDCTLTVYCPCSLNTSCLAWMHKN